MGVFLEQEYQGVENQYLPIFTPSKITDDGEEIDPKITGGKYFPCVVPYRHLFGILAPEEYNTCQRQRVENKYKQMGWDYLREEPPLACAIGNESCIMPVVIEGHHRVRYAPQIVKQHGVPIVFVTLEAAAKLWNYSSPLVFEQYLTDSVSEMIRTFSGLYGSINRPYRVPEFISGDAARMIWQQIHTTGSSSSSHKYS